MADAATNGGGAKAAAQAALERRLEGLSPQQLAALQQKLRRRAGGSYAAIERHAEQRSHPLSYHQRRLWFMEQLQPGTPLYNVSRAILLEGNLDARALQGALQALVARHEVLRTTYHARDGEPVQCIEPPCELPLRCIDVPAAGPGASLEALLQGPLRDEARRPFDFARDLMIRAVLFRLDAQRHVLLLTIHHLACDGWSLRLLFDELSQLYAGRLHGHTPPLPDIPIRYVDFARWQRSAPQESKFARRIAWWQEQLAGAPPVLELPTDNARPPLATGAGAFMPLALPRSLRDALDALAGRERVTRYTVMLAAFVVLLHRYSGMRRFLVGTVSAGRQRQETQRVFGFFVDTVVLQADLSGAPSLREMLHRIRDTSVSAMEHADVPFDRIIEALDLPRDLSRSGLIQVMFNAPPQYQLAFEGLRASPLDVDAGVARFDLEMTHAEGANKRTGITWSTDLFTPSTIERMGRHYRTLLEQFLRDADQPVSAVPLLTPEERRQILLDWSTGPRDAGVGTRVHRLFEARAAAAPERTAVVVDGAALDYRELNAAANRVAHCLLDRGVQANELVGLCMDRSLELAAAILGILKAGAAYVPLDPAYPQQRLDTIIQDTALRLVLTDAALADRFGALDCITAADTAGCPAGNPAAATGPDHLAYVIFTSGSTGRPKGVMVEHGALGSFLAAAQRVVQLDAGARLLSVTTISFDIFALELFLPLLHGATVVIASRATAMDGTALATLLARSKATHLQATPATWQLLLDADWRPSPGFTGLCGGEMLPRDLALAAAGRCSRFLNWYGPTEATVWATVADVDPRSYRAGNIGRPLANYRAYVLDGEGCALPAGLPGELHIGGPGLARGYFRNKQLTAQRFLRHAEFGRLYRTGDRARWRDDGMLEFLGRLDDQLKLRGYRIEPGDVEAALARHPAVTAAVVTLVDEGLQRRLAAYLVGREALSERVVAEIRAHAGNTLPDYMRPAQYLVVDRLPLTPNGKIDRRALPAPADTAQAGDDPRQVAPRTELQRRMAAIWAEVLGVPRVGISDDFFELGGHSLLVLRLLGRMEKEAGVQFELLDLFRKRTIEELTADADGGADPRAGSAPLTAIRARGSLTPFFAVGSHPGYVDAAARIDPERPFYRLDVYALQARRRRTGAAMLRSVEAIAAELLEEVTAVQPAGPYLLGGGCEGAPVAFELASLLQARGEEVRTLILWITPLPGCAGGFFGKPASVRVARMFRHQLAPALLADPGPSTLRSVWQHAAIEFRIFRAVDRYRPRRDFRGTIDFLRTERHRYPEASDATRGWGSVATGGATVRQVPGDHDTWLTQHAARFGEVLDELLAARA